MSVNRPGAARQTAWFRAYRQRMDIGLERCRNCKRSHSGDNPLRFSHIVPNSAGGRCNLSNVTIMCQECDTRQGNTLWIWQMSLAKEEQAAPPEHRWSQRATARKRPRQRPPADHD